MKIEEMVEELNRIQGELPVKDFLMEDDGEWRRYSTDELRGTLQLDIDAQEARAERLAKLDAKSLISEDEMLAKHGLTEKDLEGWEDVEVE